LEFIYEYGLFLAQAMTLVAAILIIVAGLISLGHRQKAEQHEGHIEINPILHGVVDYTLGPFERKKQILVI